MIPEAHQVYTSRELKSSQSPKMGQKPSSARRGRTRKASSRKKALRTDREEPGIETAPSMTTLPKSSTELILDIADLLARKVTTMSLSYSCRTIRNKMGASIAHVLGDKASPGRPSSGSTLSAENAQHPDSGTFGGALYVGP